MESADAALKVFTVVPFTTQSIALHGRADCLFVIDWCYSDFLLQKT
jgi:hypothetical protein